MAASLLVAATLVAYVPAVYGGFVLDDDQMVAENPLLHSLDGLWSIWSRGVPNEHYWPITYSAFWLEYQLWGLAPAGYHAVNVLLHAASALLLWRVLERITIRGAWLAAAIFALHPVHVESVAWVIELKDVLVGIAYLAAFLAYVVFTEKQQWRWYALSFAFFAVALLSKLPAVTFPLGVAVWLWWRSGRLVWDDAKRLAPMLGLGAVVGLADVVRVNQVQTYHFGLSPLERILVAARALCFYAGKLAWPADLIPIYPRWTIDSGAPAQWVAPGAVVAALSLAVLAQKRLGRGPLAAAAFFIVTLVPALGFVDHAFMRWSLVADRFQYLASIGPIALVAVGAARASALSRVRPLVTQAASAGLLLVLGILTWRQAAIYASPETFYGAVIASNPGSMFAHYNLASALYDTGRVDEAIEHYEEALRLDPDSAEVCNNLANALAQSLRLDEAIQHYQRALRLRPDFAQTHSNLATILAAKGRTDEAIEHYQQALRLEPDRAKDHYGLGNALAARGRTSEARIHYEEAVRLDPNFVKTDGSRHAEVGTGH
jgi:tetratricopeptide (TPR) repeat protein